MFKLKPTGELTYISRGTQCEGNIRASGNLRLDGTILGAVEVEGDLEVSPSGRIEGEYVRARNVLLQGTIRARVSAAAKLTLSREARLEGDVVAGALDIAAGAVYIGHIQTSMPEARLEPPASPTVAREPAGDSEVVALKL